jgi:hypothetical protein
LELILGLELRVRLRLRAEKYWFGHGIGTRLWNQLRGIDFGIDSKDR